MLFQRVVGSEEPLIIDNLHGDSPFATEYRDWAAMHADEAFVSAQSVLAVPLKVKGQVIGQLRLDHDQPGFYRPRHADWPSLREPGGHGHRQRAVFEAERRSREHLVLALEAGQMGTWEWESATGSGTWSPQLEAIRGLAPARFAQTFEAPSGTSIRTTWSA